MRVVSAEPSEPRSTTLCRLGNLTQRLSKASLFALVFFSSGLAALPQDELAPTASVDLSPGITPVEAPMTDSEKQELLEQVTESLRENMETIKFIRNDGQWDEAVLYKGLSLTGQVIVERDGLRFVTPQNTNIEGEKVKGVQHWSLKFEGSQGVSDLIPSNWSVTRTSYLGKGKDVSLAPAAYELKLSQVYPGIDLRLYSREAGRLEFDWIIAPGVDHRQIQLRAEGVDGLDLSDPNLPQLAMQFHDVQLSIPESYQVNGDEKLPIQSEFTLQEDNLLSYHVSSAINPELPLVIDPDINWGSFMDAGNSSFDEYLYGIDVGPCQNGQDTDDLCVYAVGSTDVDLNIDTMANSGYITFPKENSITPYDEDCNSCSGTNGDAVVYVLSEDGTDILYATHFGGTDRDEGYGIAISENRVFISGTTQSDNEEVDGEGFPITDGSGVTTAAFDSAKNGSYDGYVAVFDKQLTTLYYATYLGSTAGGNPDDETNCEDITSIRAISDTSYVVGGTMCAALDSSYLVNADNLDTTYAVDGGGSSGREGWLGYFSALATLQTGTYIGGNERESLNDVFVLSNNSIAFAGTTNCDDNDTAADCTSDTGFPTLVADPGVEAICGENESLEDQGFVGVINMAADNDPGFSMLSRIGGCSDDQFSAVYQIETDGDLYVGGSTTSDDAPLAGSEFDAHVPYDSTLNGTRDAWVGRIPVAGGDGFWRATLFGGTGEEIANSLSGFFGGVFIFGTTSSTDDSFPTANIGTGSFFSSTHGGGTLDMFFTTLTADLTSLIFSTYIGGDLNDYLGDTGNPRGSNHIFSDGENFLWLGTTIHSGPTSYTHCLVNSAATTLIPDGCVVPGFDSVKSNADTTTNDIHYLMQIGRVGTNVLLQKEVTNNSGGNSGIDEFTLTLGKTGFAPDQYNHGAIVAVDPDIAYTFGEILENSVGVGYTQTGITCVDDGSGDEVGAILGNNEDWGFTPEIGRAYTCTVSNDDNGNGVITLDKVGEGPLTGGLVGVGQDMPVDGALAYQAPGDVLEYDFVVENTGNVRLGTVSIDDDQATDEDCPALNTIGNNDDFFDPTEEITCTASFTVDQGDIDSGSVLNTATATAQPVGTGDAVDSNQDTLLLLANQLPDISIDKVGTKQNGGDGDQAGDIITYTLAVTNDGNVTLAPVTVTDTLIPNAGISCPGTNNNTITSLPPAAFPDDPAATVTCTASYTVTLDDMNQGFVFNTGTGEGACNNQIECPVDDDDDDTQILTPAPAVMIDKTGALDTGGDGANPGDMINYTLTVTNIGNVTLDSVTVTDPIIMDAQIDCGAGTNVTIAMDPGDMIDCSASYAITQTDIDAGTRDNIATATGACAFVDQQAQALCPVMDDDDHMEPIPTTPAIMIVKDGVLDLGGDGVANVGDDIDYTFEVTNTGNVTLYDVLVTDPRVPSIDCAGVNPIVSLMPNAMVTCTGAYQITQDDINTGTVPNTATAAGKCDVNDADPCATDDDDHDEPIPQRPSVEIVKDGVLVIAGQEAVPGDVINYTLQVTNTGNMTLTSVLVSDPLLGAISCAPEANPIASMEPGDIVNCTGSYAITQGDINNGLVENTATVSGECTALGGICPVTDNDDHDEPIRPGPSIDIDKTGTLEAGPDGFANPGDIINYTLVVTNDGNVTLFDVSVTDPLLGAVDCAPQANPIVNMDPGAMVTCTGSYAITQQDIETGSVPNTATATGTCPDIDEGGPCEVTDMDDHEEPLPVDPSVMIEKTGALDAGADNTPTVGDMINYTFTVTNTGNLNLTSVAVTDPLVPAITCPGGNPIPTMAPGDMVDCTGSYAITQADIDTGNVPNTATVTGECREDQVCPVTDDDDHDEPLDGGPSIEIIKNGSLDAGADGAGVGDTIDYTFDVTNTGNVTLTTVTVTDPKIAVISCPGGNPFGPLAPQEMVQCTGEYLLTEADLMAGSVLNTATATGECTNTTLCPTDDDDDHEEPLPLIDLSKTAGMPVLEDDGSYTVEFTITAANSGQAAGTYNIVDTLAPATGLTLVGNPTLVYAGGETETGTPGVYPNLITGEGLGIGATESWTLTANFTVDPSEDLTAARACDPGAPVINTGFYNTVSGSASDFVPDNNDACTNLPDPEIDLAKTIETVEFTGANQQTVTYLITATNTGDGPAIFDVLDNLNPGNGLVPELPPTVTYVAIDDSFASPVTAPPGWPAISTGETLAGQSSESWRIVVVFNGDTNADGFEETLECQRDGEGWIEGRGFYNEVEVVLGETDTSNNEVCATPALAYLTLVKVVENGVGGTASASDFALTVTGTDGIHDSGVDYATGDLPEVSPTVEYTVSETEGQVDEYVLEGIVCVDDSTQADLGSTFTLAEGQAVTCTVTNVFQEVIIESLAEVCINDVPYINYNVSTVGVDPTPTETTIRFYSDGGNGSNDPADYTTLVDTIPASALSGQILWPGATVDMNGNGLTWPGWQEQPDGTWIEIDDGLVPLLLMEFEINPTTEQLLEYPPRTENCVPPQGGGFVPMPVPVNNPWAILLLMLSMLGVAWYFRPERQVR